MEIPVQHHPDRKRFELQIAGETAYAEYLEHGQTLVLTHTFVPPPLRGKGLAGILVRHVLNFARKEQKTVDPQCSYAAAFLNQHLEYADLRMPRS
ncbi:MAG: GNAT family N-acetyltransferase [Limisphaerales bacterium]